MCAAATATPYFAPKGVGITGESYLSHLADNLFPAMAFTAASAGFGKYSLQQDGASSHLAPPVLAAIKKNAPLQFPFARPAKSPDLNPCDFFLCGAMTKEIEQSIPPA